MPSPRGEVESRALLDLLWLVQPRERAIYAAREARLLHDEALANELCALHYRDKGRQFRAW
ncbi:hypothetical protein [Sorangium sp. So ce176]|uniref:hypothetical protein n=1 Tax=Sorangium sp. So ce176 TaxID=3133286 RepID=UPI003F61F63B